MNNPKNWPISAPPYFSVEGYEYEKKLAKEKILFEIRDKRAEAVLKRHLEIQKLAIQAQDHEMFERWNDRIMELIQYRLKLMEDYKDALLWGED